MIIGGVVLLLITAAVVMAVLRLQKDESVKKGKIAGMVLEKKSGKGAEGVKVSLGSIEVTGRDNNFIPIQGKKVITKEDGKFLFEGLPLKIYWIMAERNGRKVIKPVKLSEFDREIEDIGIII